MASTTRTSHEPHTMPGSLHGGRQNMLYDLLTATKFVSAPASRAQSDDDDDDDLDRGPQRQGLTGSAGTDKYVADGVHADDTPMRGGSWSTPSMPWGAPTWQVQRDLLPDGEGAAVDYGADDHRWRYDMDHAQPHLMSYRQRQQYPRNWTGPNREPTRSSHGINHMPIHAALIPAAAAEHRIDMGAENSEDSYSTVPISQHRTNDNESHDALYRRASLLGGAEVLTGMRLGRPVHGTEIPSCPEAEEQSPSTNPPRGRKGGFKQTMSAGTGNFERNASNGSSSVVGVSGSSTNGTVTKQSRAKESHRQAEQRRRGEQIKAVMELKNELHLHDGTPLGETLIHAAEHIRQLQEEQATIMAEIETLKQRRRNNVQVNSGKHS